MPRSPQLKSFCLPRRVWLATSVSAGVLHWLSSGSASWAGEPDAGPAAEGAGEGAGDTHRVLLAAPPEVLSREIQVHSVLEVTGELLSRPTGTEKEPRVHALKAIGDLVYAERVPAGGQGAQRWYQQAHADIDVDGRPRRVTLRDDRRWLVVAGGPERRQIRAADGHLTRDELELIDVPGGTHVLHELLPGREVAVGETWQPSDGLVAQLLNLDAVTSQDMMSRLEQFDDGAAQIALQGKVLGAIRGVITEIRVDGKYRFDRQLQRVVWLALGIQEDREAGLAEPGLRVKARLRVAIEASQQPQLRDEPFANLQPDPTGTGEGLVEYRAASEKFSLVHHRGWYLFQEQPDLTVLRWIDQNRLIAQCNLRPLPAASPGNELTLAKFQTEIQTALGSSLQQVLDRQESTLANETKQLRVAVVGQVANAPIHWIYYHLTDKSGQRITCVFTMSGDQIEKFAAEDMSFVNSLTLHTQSENAAETQPVAQTPGLQR